MAKFSQGDIAASLIPRDQWRPFPRAKAEWERTVPEATRQLLLAEAEQYLNKPFAALPASLILEYQRSGNRTAYEDVSFAKREQLFALVLGETLEQKGRFLPDIVNGIWSTCEESYWGIPAHLYMQRAGAGMPDVQDPSVDIFAVEASTLLALTDYFLGEKLDSISPLLRKRIYHEVDRRILTPMESSSAGYWYMQKGSKAAPVNNWNPWVVSCWMASLLLVEPDQQRRVRELQHAMLTLDNYLNWLGEDGAIDEGPSYWSGAIGRLFDALNVLESASGGKLQIYDQPLVQMAESYIYKVHIAGNYFINTADASPTINQDGLLLYRIGRSVNDTTMRQFGSWAYHYLNKAERNPVQKDFSKTRRLWNLLAIRDCAAEKGESAEPAEVWLPGIQLMASRTPEGLFVASHGGHNAESHNHNDVGDVVLYAGGEPVVIDVGFGTYTAKTFSKERYTLWYNNSAYHNLPVINGFAQEAGAHYEAREVAYRKSAKVSSLEMDIAAAYPAEAGILAWKRNVSLDKSSNKLIINDQYNIQEVTKPLTQTFMTVCNAQIDQPGRVTFEIPNQKPVTLHYDPAFWQLTKEQMPTDAPDEKRLADNWGHRPVWRILLTARNRKKSGTIRYIFQQ
ncbi:heparinase II/III family protein [Dyadobacter sp. CY261]|uniref:heparinase II/III domain-containing protein n=1 Tax=Dyadobacter sp. CY261 TaxID=2907203 RepID=UPI001F1C3447|nr:heparinase II/III family protein [Dyadobacter sp. CY261]